MYFPFYNFNFTFFVLSKAMNRKEKNQGEPMTDDSMPESSLESGSDYIPSSSPSSEDEDEVKSQLKVKNTGDDERETLIEGGGPSGVTVKTCFKGEKRKWDKRHYCVYCTKPQSKMARHLIRKHNDEKEVALAICLPPKSKKRKEMFEQLRRKGNYFHNLKVLQSGRGEIVTYRQPSSDVNADDYLPCNICFGFFVKTKLWRHEKLCQKRFSGIVTESKAKRRVQTAASSLLPFSGQPSERCSNLICRMVVDKVSAEVKNDQLISEYGDRLLEKHRNEHSEKPKLKKKGLSKGKRPRKSETTDESD
ncbi:hypothetical protein DNTS_009422, partial [Danionella cerebrum]